MSRAQGSVSEAVARRYLERVGYKILTTNYQIRQGEIDLVARDGAYLCFVEVRSRATAKFGRPEETIDGKKRARIIKAARHYLHVHGLHDEPCRFDVVAIVGDEVTLYKNAFESS